MQGFLSINHRCSENKKMLIHMFNLLHGLTQPHCCELGTEDGNAMITPVLRWVACLACLLPIMV